MREETAQIVDQLQQFLQLLGTFRVRSKLEETVVKIESLDGPRVI